MQKLSEAMTRGKYVVAQVTAEHQLKKRLSEMGMVRGKVLTVITQNMQANGAMIHFQGQRLALSDSIASCIEVLSVNELAEQELKPLSHGIDAKYFSYSSKHSTIRRPARDLVTGL